MSIIAEVSYKNKKEFKESIIPILKSIDESSKEIYNEFSNEQTQNLDLLLIAIESFESAKKNISTESCIDKNNSIEKKDFMNSNESNLTYDDKDSKSYNSTLNFGIDITIDSIFVSVIGLIIEYIFTGNISDEKIVKEAVRTLTKSFYSLKGIERCAMASLCLLTKINKRKKILGVTEDEILSFRLEKKCPHLTNRCNNYCKTNDYCQYNDEQYTKMLKTALINLTQNGHIKFIDKKYYISAIIDLRISDNNRGKYE